MSKQTSLQLSEATLKQIEYLKQRGFGSQTNIVRLAVDRMYEQERRRGMETEPVKIERAKLVVFSKDQLDTQPYGTWDDNGGEPDGDLWLLPLDEVEPFEGMDVVDGYIVHAYSGDANYHHFCGFSSRDVAYTIDEETAKAIAYDEYSIRQ